MPATLLAGTRVLDLADPESAFAARVLADLGADITLIEPPEGAVLRRIGPRLSHGESAAFWHYRAGSATRTLDPAEAAGRAALRDLLSGADLVLDRAAPGGLAAFGLDSADLRRDFPHLVIVALTPFGRTGPRRDWLGGDYLAWAAGGTMSLLGSADREPLDAPWQATHFAGLWAAIGGLAALAARRQTGRGQTVDLSLQEAVAAHAMGAVIFATYAGQRVVRRGGESGLVCPSVVAPCRDGYIQVVTVVRRQWQTLVRWLADDGAVAGFDDPRYIDAAHRIREKDRLHDVICRWTANWAKHDLFREAQGRGLAFGVVQSLPELAADPQLREREFIETLAGPPGGPSVRRPSAPYWVRAAGTGAAEADGPGVAPEGGKAARPGAGAGSNAALEPLQGVRILDFSWVLAGPFATRILGDLGAEVIKVEARGAGDGARWNPPFKDGERGIDRGGLFNELNHNKRSLTVDLKHPEGRAIVERLALEWADAIVENFGAGTLERLGLDSAVLTARQPRLSVIRLAGFGQTGPYRDYLGYAPAIHALAGLTESIRYSDSRPLGVAVPVGDYAGGLYGALLTSAALLNRERTGRGSVVDLSQFEAAVGMNGPDLTRAWSGVTDPDSTSDAGSTDRVARWLFSCRPGTWSPATGPPEAIERWIAVAPSTPEQIGALHAFLIGEGQVASGPAEPGSLKSGLQVWLAARDVTEAATTLQAAGVPAAEVREAWELVRSDPQLAARGFYGRIQHPTCGEVVVQRVPLLFSNSATTVRRPAPLLGEHNEDILGNLLGLSEDAVTDLVLREVV